MGKKLSLEDIPELPGFLPVAVIAERYGVHKGKIYYMIFTQNLFQRVFKVSTGGDSKRPLLLLDADEVVKVFNERASRPYAKLVREWHRRVKDWGRAQGWTQTPIQISGAPQQALVLAYLKANPSDPRPD